MNIYKPSKRFLWAFTNPGRTPNEERKINPQGFVPFVEYNGDLYLSEAYTIMRLKNAKKNYKLFALVAQTELFSGKSYRVYENRLGKKGFVVFYAEKYLLEADKFEQVQKQLEGYPVEYGKRLVEESNHTFYCQFEFDV